MSELTQARLREVLRYDAGSGHFYRGSRAKPVGYLNAKGYISIRVDKRQYLAHRLAWLYVHGVMPKSLDHINRARADNRIENLRLATHGENQRNRWIGRLNTSGLKGVYWHSTQGNWQSQIHFNGRSYHLGTFQTKDAAFEAYKAAAQRLHGEFACVSPPEIAHDRG